MNTITEIQAALGELVAAMVEKGVVTPRADLTIKPEGLRVYLKTYECRHTPFDGRDFKFVEGDTPAEAFDAARAYIAALPSPEEAGMREFLGSLSDTMEIARKHSLDDKYVAPLRGVSTAMTENLLTKEPNT